MQYNRNNCGVRRVPFSTVASLISSHAAEFRIEAVKRVFSRRFVCLALPELVVRRAAVVDAEVSEQVTVTVMVTVHHATTATDDDEQRDEEEHAEHNPLHRARSSGGALSLSLSLPITLSLAFAAGALATAFMFRRRREQKQ